MIFECGKIQKRGDIGSTLNISLDVDPLLTKSELYHYIKDVLIGDANTGWTVHQVAAIIMR